MPQMCRKNCSFRGFRNEKNVRQALEKRLVNHNNFLVLFFVASRKVLVLLHRILLLLLISRLFYPLLDTYLRVLILFSPIPQFRKVTHEFRIFRTKSCKEIYSLRNRTKRQLCSLLSFTTKTRHAYDKRIYILDSPIRDAH